MVNKLLRGSTSFLFKQQTSILSAAVIMMVLIFASRVLGLLRIWFMARYFGVSGVTDAFNAAFVIPDLLANVLITGALSVAFIPVFTDYLSKKDTKDSNLLASTILNFSLLVYAFVAIFIFIFPLQINQLVGINLQPPFDQTAASLMRLVVLGEFLLVIGSFFTSVLQTHHRFLIAALAPVVYNLGIIFGIVVLSRFFGIMGVGLGVVFGAVLHVSVQMLALKSVGFDYKGVLKLKNPDVLRILKLSLPRAIGVGVGQLEVVVNVILASALAVGSITVLKYSWDLQNVPIGLFGLAFATAALPSLSKEWSQDKTDDFKRTFLASLFQLLYFAVPFSVLLAVLRIPLVRLAFGSGLFDWTATVATATTMSWFAIGIFAQAGFLLVTRAFYAMHDTLTPLKVAVVSLLLHASLGSFFIFFFAKEATLPVAYLGLTTTISGAFSFFSLLFLLNRKVGGFGTKQLLYPTVKIVVPAMIMAVFLYIPLHIHIRGEFIIDYIIDTRRALNLLFLTAFVAVSGLSLYVFFTWLFKSEELATFRKMLPDLRRFTRILNFEEPVDTTHSAPRP